MPRKTDADNPADWLWICASDLEAIRLLAAREIGDIMCRSKLAEVLEKVLKAELLRTGWTLEKTHDLRKLASALHERQSDLLEQIRPLVVQLAEAYMLDRYPGFDVEDPDWPVLRTQIEQVAALHAIVQARVTPS